MRIQVLARVLTVGQFANCPTVQGLATKAVTYGVIAISPYVDGGVEEKNARGKVWPLTCACVCPLSRRPPPLYQS